MRLSKILGLAVVSAVAAMAFLGTSSAMATFNTALCDEKSTALECPENHLIHEFTMKAGTTVFKTSVATILCLGSNLIGEVESDGLLGSPLQIKITVLTWEECGTNAAHDNCTITNEKLPLWDVLKIGEDLAEATALGGEIHVTCPLINCYFGGAEIGTFEVESALHSVGAGSGMFTSPEILEPKVKGFLCPADMHWTALYEPLEHLWIRS